MIIDKKIAFLDIPYNFYYKYLRNVFLFYLYNIYILFFSFIIHMCIKGLVHFSPLPPPPPLPPTLPPPSPPSSIPSRNYFALISNFVVERV
jgi:hypothetical protein